MLPARVNEPSPRDRQRDPPVHGGQHTRLHKPKQRDRPRPFRNIALGRVGEVGVRDVQADPAIRVAVGVIEHPRERNPMVVRCDETLVGAATSPWARRRNPWAVSVCQAAASAEPASGAPAFFSTCCQSLRRTEKCPPQRSRSASSESFWTIRQARSTRSRSSSSRPPSLRAPRRLRRRAYSPGRRGRSDPRGASRAPSRARTPARRRRRAIARCRTALRGSRCRDLPVRGRVPE